MVLDVYIENQLYKINIPENVLQDGGDFFDKMDRDMEAGWKVGPEYIENPDSKTRAQIAANKLATAIQTENSNLTSLMAGYIVTRLPGVEAVNIDMNGEPLNTEFIIK